ncbi:unnamed protein product [Chrysoparadoxa australica]
MDINWGSSYALSTSPKLDPSKFTTIAFIDNRSSDTQCLMWRDKANKRLIASFRGTESVKDMITDLYGIQEPYDSKQSQLERSYSNMVAQFDEELKKGRNEGLAWLRELWKQRPGSGRKDIKRLGSGATGEGKACEESRLEEVKEAALAVSTKEGRSVIESWYDEALVALSDPGKHVPPLPKISSLRGFDMKGAEAKGKSLIGKVRNSFSATRKWIARDLKEEAAAKKKTYDETPRVHAGFRGAMCGIQETTAAAVMFATGGVPEGWHIYVTGHSLGGALATLCAVDFADRFKASKLTMYNFGSPRVGNSAFARLYNEKHAGAFRIVNDMDMIARLPPEQPISFLEYSHVGRTVLVKEGEREGKADGKKDKVFKLWVEGEDSGTCPLKDIDTLEVFKTRDDKAIRNELDKLQALVMGNSIAHHLEDSYYAALVPALKLQVVGKEKQP